MTLFRNVLARFAFVLFCAPPLFAQDTRLSNVSVRTSAGGADTLITGFTIGPGSNKTVLVRAVGPTLGAFGVAGTLADPKLELFNSSSVKIAENDNWSAADAAAFSSVGAFALGASSKDAALVATLAPGSYTAQITGVGGASGVALVEVYEVTGGATRLINLSTRAQVGTGANVLIPGITVAPGTGTRRLLLRAVGPTLAAFGVPGTLADPKLELYSGNTKIAENDNWGTPVGATTADAATLTAAFAANGAFALTAGSKDAALLISLGAGSYTLQVSGVGNGTGAALVEVYDISAVIVPPTISAQPQSLTLTAGASGSLSVSAASAVASTYQWFKDGAPVAGATSATVTLASAQAANAGAYTVVVTNGGGSVTSATATLTVKANQSDAKASASLYLAQLRPDPSATNSAASGYATIRINSDGTATVNVSFTNLTSTQTSAHLQLGASRDFVLNLPLGQVSGRSWTFSPSGAYTTNDLINALNTGNIFVGLDSANFPSGELRGNFITATGSQTFSAPPAPPALAGNALTAPSQTDAVRFLNQATFGPILPDINLVMSQGITKWITDQMALSATSLTTAIRADITAFPLPPPTGTNEFKIFTYENLNAAWWKVTVTATDQLRQRVAFALSEIFVVGDNSMINNEVEAKAKFYDILVNGAFGSYRQLLENVTLNPLMGRWLSHLGNQKTNPVTGTSPDENYAREVMQLFSIGLVQLQPDGTLLLDAAGQPIPTYNQAIVGETAKVLTGWAFANANVSSATSDVAEYTRLGPSTSNQFLGDDNPWLLPMRYYDAFHDFTQKKVVSVQQVPLAEATLTVVPANRTGPEDLKILLDALSNHPNAGPFISRHLIKFLVTSNPSPAYVYRVARVFANDGAGVRGNLGAVVRAILTDYEARSPDVLGNAGYGKIKEPLIRVSGFIRALNVRAPNGRFMDSYFSDPRGNGFNPVSALRSPISPFAQEALFSPSVFNFFSPDYSPPGSMAAAGLVAPELQITDSFFSISLPNELLNLMYRLLSSLPEPPAGPSPFLVVDYSALLPSARNPTALADQLNLLFYSNQMSASTRAAMVTLLSGLPAAATDTERVQSALHLMLFSPDAATQK